MEIVVKSRGANRSEEILSSLCEKAFLPLWCYPNLFRAKGKELADVLVVFGDDVVIFSDKACSFPDTGNLELDWSRWKRRSIDESYRQLVRARRWLREHPTELYLDAACSKPFPLSINPHGRFHMVVVARHAKARCARHHPGNGSLAIHGPTVAPPVEAHPFHIYLSEYNQFVHVFDEVSLPLVLGELDTATDFLEYLEKKRSAFESGQIIGSFGEEETLALFLVSVLHWKRHDGERAFPDLTGQPIIVGRGSWTNLRGKSEYTEKKHADKVSYLWDSLLKGFGNGVHRNSVPNPLNVPLARLEWIGRRLASETRFRRRELSTALVTARSQVKPGHVLNRTCMSRKHPKTAYVFSLIPLGEDPYEEYREFRRSYALMYAAHTLRRARRIDEVIAIATEFGHADECSFEFVLLQRGEDTELNTLADEFARDHGWATDLRELRWFGSSSHEFPRTSQRRQRAARQEWQRQRRKQRKSQRHARKVSRRKR